MTTPACPSYAGYRFPAEIISHAVWLYFRFPLSLRMVDELLAARGIIVSYETLRQWARKFGQAFANQIRRGLLAAGDKWHMDEVVITFFGVSTGCGARWTRTGIVLDVWDCPGSVALPHFAWSHSSSISCQVTDPKMRSALAYLAVYGTLAEASRYKFRSNFQ